ncbi:MAG TPA: antibiotic biosynthesis monooxygenase family protein [Candidatus Sulfotelmatobacter sp.]|nr:antibiotic biosynthesis monooxygenase family protein [Candidatus Sulfotelmatobacter sp.]
MGGGESAGSAETKLTKGNGLGEGPLEGEPLYWGVSIQTIDVGRLDAYLASVSDQEGALADSQGFYGRMVLRSQRRHDRFWLVDCWSDELSLSTATIQLRTVSSVAGLIEEPRTIDSIQIRVGKGVLPVLPKPVKQGVRPDQEGARQPQTSGMLRFYLIAENWIKRVSGPEYLEVQQKFTQEMEEEEGFRCRLLLRDLAEPVHYLVIDEWESEQFAFEAFERRQARLSEATMSRFLSFMAKRGEPDFALGLHGT